MHAGGHHDTTVQSHKLARFKKFGPLATGLEIIFGMMHTLIDGSKLSLGYLGVIILTTNLWAYMDK